MPRNSSILITGGTGSFGHFCVPMTLARCNPRWLAIYSRDEMKQCEMAKLYGNDDRVRFFIGDVRDKDRLSQALNGMDFVVQAAATKIVSTAVYNPFDRTQDPKRINGGQKVKPDFIYCSDNNTEWMSNGTLRDWIEQNREKIGKL